MSLLVKLRRGEGPFWGRLKRLARWALRAHVPVFWLNRPLFSLLYHAHVAGRGLIERLLRFFWYEPLFRSQAAVGAGFQMEQMPYIHGTGRIVLGDGVSFSGKPQFIFGNRADTHPELVIGDHTFIGHGCTFAVSHSLRIGRRHRPHNAMPGRAMSTSRELRSASRSRPGPQLTCRHPTT